LPPSRWCVNGHVTIRAGPTTWTAGRDTWIVVANPAVGEPTGSPWPLHGSFIDRPVSAGRLIAAAAGPVALATRRSTSCTSRHRRPATRSGHRNQFSVAITGRVPGFPSTPQGLPKPSSKGTPSDIRSRVATFSRMVTWLPSSCLNEVSWFLSSTIKTRFGQRREHGRGNAGRFHRPCTSPRRIAFASGK